MWSALILVHISTAVISLVSGFLATAFRKGSGLHNAAGTVFFVSMVAMTTSAAYLAIFHKPQAINVVASFLTLYLVVTARIAARRRNGGTSRIDVIALAAISLVGAGGILWGFKVANSARKGMAVPLFIFAMIALLCARSDFRMIKRGGVVGAQRIARHLWRMSLSLLIATLSFYPGQARQLPMWLRETNLLFIPHILLIGSMAFWMYRVRRRKRLRPETVTADPGIALAA